MDDLARRLADCLLLIRERAKTGTNCFDLNPELSHKILKEILKQGNEARSLIMKADPNGMFRARRAVRRRMSQAMEDHNPETCPSCRNEDFPRCPIE
tara:strand:- start:1293 stop:1583 length:291 start_codon:yes stop_codon:yes gene_type:complete